MRLPVFAAASTEENQVDTDSYDGWTYLECGEWDLEGERISMKMVQKPVPGSILVNDELAPTAEQKKAMEQLSKEHRIYVLGAQSAAYKSLSPEAVILDGYVKKELYLQPAAWEFFGAFESYVGNKALEYDALERICKTFGVKEDIP